MPQTGLEKSFGRKCINESYRSIQVGTPLTRTTSSSVFEYHQKSLSTWQPSILEVEYRLPTIENPQTDSAAFRSIAAETLYDLITSKTQEEFNKEFILVDCRYHYEYNGGHIKYSINLYEPHKVQSIFYPDDEDEFDTVCTKVPIFYCEYSQARGPKMAHSLRKFDRRRNEAVYPIVDYPEMYLLDGGYKKFYEQFQNKNVCTPDKYVPMNCKKFKSILKKFNHHKVKPLNNKKEKDYHIDLNESSVIIRKRRLKINGQPVRKKISCNVPMMTSTPSRPVPTKSTLVQDELSKIPSWRSNINSFPSTSEWDSSFDTSLTELESSAFESQIKTTELSFGQSKAILALDLNTSSRMRIRLGFESDSSSLM